jgi:hypothetical protein
MADFEADEANINLPEFKVDPAIIEHLSDQEVFLRHFSLLDKELNAKLGEICLTDHRAHGAGSLGQIVAIMDKWHLDNGNGGGSLACLPGLLPSDSGPESLPLAA